MILSDTAIERPVLTLVAMLALVVFGVYSLVRLEVDEFPDIQPPIVVILVPYPGASPTVVEREVVDPLEDVIGGISGVDELTSTSFDGFAQIVVTFVYSKNLVEATQEIRDQISATRDDLPREIEEPIIQTFDPTQLPIVTLALSSATLDAAGLTRVADPGITSALRGTEGVAEVRVMGDRQRELSVLVEPDALTAHHIGLLDVVTALETANLAAPVGHITEGLEERPLRLSGRLDTPADFDRLVLTERGGAVVRLGDVARAVDSVQEAVSLAFYDGRPAVGIEVLKSSGYSTAAVAEAILARVDSIRPSIPEGVELRVVKDAGERVRASVTNVEQALLEGVALTVVVVFLFLNSWRSMVITGLALPISMIAAFIPILAFGFTLNTMSLLGLSLAIGILIDDAIVVRENIARHIQGGKDHYTAARDATNEIGLAVTATTLTIVVVFVPVAFMGDMAGEWLRPFALTIVFAVLVSLFVAFSLDPMLSAHWHDPALERGRERGPIGRLLKHFNDWFDRRALDYRRVIAWALDHRLAIALLALGSFIGALVLQITVGGAAFAPITDESRFEVSVEAPPGSSLEYTRIKAAEASAIARSMPEVDYSFTTVGGARGVIDEARIFLRLVPRSQRVRSQAEVGRALRDRLSRVAGASYSVFSTGFGAHRKQIQLELRGPEEDRLTALAERLADQLRQVPGAADVGLSTRGREPELELEIDRGLSGQLGLSVAHIAGALRAAFAGVQAGTWIDPQGETREVRVRLAPEARHRAEDVEQIPLIVRDAQGLPQVIPLGQVVRVNESLAPARITHLDQRRVVYVEANTSGRPLSGVLQGLHARIDSIPLPAGYTISMGGEAESQQEVFGAIFGALVLAIALMYLLLVAQFNSFVDPVAIMISLPLSLIGVVLALLFTGDTLNIMSMIGIILLMGIVVKNAILLIDFAKWRQKEGTDRRDAIIEAGAIRLRPILMTTLSTIAGMIPVALGWGEGADFRAPLGRAVIGGMITSTILTLLVIPTFYDVLDGWKRAAMARFRER